MLGMVKRDENGALPVSKEQLVMFYHAEFVGALKQFGYMKAPPSLLDLNVELLKHGALGAIHDFAFTPFLFIDWSTLLPEDLVALPNDNSDRVYKVRMKMFEHPTCQKIIKEGLKTWMAKGIL